MQDVNTMRNIKWSATEKAVARKAFDWALKREMETVIQITKKRAAAITSTSDLWEIESYLTNRRKQIDCEFDYKYSVLPQVFANLLCQRKLSENQLQGLSEEKMELIRELARRRGGQVRAAASCSNA